jgi:hypothetical protein
MVPFHGARILNFICEFSFSHELDKVDIPVCLSPCFIPQATAISSIFNIKLYSVANEMLVPIEFIKIRYICAFTNT